MVTSVPLSPPHTKYEHSRWRVAAVATAPAVICLIRPAWLMLASTASFFLAS